MVRPSSLLANGASGVVPPQLAALAHARFNALGRPDLSNALEGQWRTLLQPGQPALTRFPIQLPTSLLKPNPRPGVADRFITDAENKTLVPGRIVLKEGDDPTLISDEAITIPFHVTQDLLDYLKRYMKADSLDGKGMDPWFVVHYGRDYDNAYWDGVYMVCGDGDKVIFVYFSKDRKVCVHEMIHGYTEFFAGYDKKNLNPISPQASWLLSAVVYGGLEYEGQSGAWNETYSDIHATLESMDALARDPKYANLKVKDLTQADEHIWRLGWQCFVGNNRDGSKSAIRNFENAPGFDRDDIGKDDQPKKMSDYFKGSEDNYGVHINSGILNHWLYQVAQSLGDLPVSEFVKIMTAIIDKAERSMHTRTTFKEGAQLIIDAAQTLYADRPEIQNAVAKAWNTVEVIGPNAVEADQVFEIAHNNRIRIFDPKARIHGDGLRQTTSGGQTFYSIGRRLHPEEAKSARQKIRASQNRFSKVDGFVRTALGLRNNELVTLIVVKDLTSIPQNAYPTTIDGLPVVLVQDAGVKGFTWS